MDTDLAAIGKHRSLYLTSPISTLRTWPILSEIWPHLTMSWIRSEPLKSVSQNGGALKYGDFIDNLRSMESLGH